MRLNRVLFGSPHRNTARAPQVEPVKPFKMLIPIALRKTVSTKSNRTTEPCCMQELAVMFACFKTNDFNQDQCLQEVVKFQDCYKLYKDKYAQLRVQERKGVPVPGEKKMTQRQMNNYLRAYPPLK